MGFGKNAVIGTLGDPKFQSAFASMALDSSLLCFRKNKKQYFIVMVLLTLSPLAILERKPPQGTSPDYYTFAVFTIFC
jgi:hypothetical protein